MKLRPITLALCLFAVAQGAVAERADRDKPLQIEANKASIDDANKTQVLEGDVVLTKGTMILKADRVVVTEDQYGFQKGSAFGGKNGLARFHQKREGKDIYVDGEAERIDYDTHSEIAEFFRRAWVKNGEDQVQGDYIWYDTVNEKYLVNAGQPGDPKGKPARVRAIIQPKSRGTPTEPASPRSPALDLKGAGGLSTPPAHE